MKPLLQEREILMEKMRILNRLSDAIEEARQVFAAAPNAKAATRIQQLQRQRDAIRRTLPKLKEAA
jgi:hypothetical protein